MTNPIGDWTDISDDPNNPEAKQRARHGLVQLRKTHVEVDLMGFVLAQVRGKRVLDIGVVSHSSRYFDQSGWRHDRIRSEASYCLGLDILEPLVMDLQAKGYNVRCVDATSSLDMGERFDVVFIGDVLEHVNNAVALLEFACRHLAPGGRIYATTPNPFSRKFYRQFRRDGVVVVNLDHLSWITPTMAMELGRRAGMRLTAYHLIKKLTPLNRWVKRLAWRFTPVEYSFPDYLYEFSPRESAAKLAS